LNIVGAEQDAAGRMSLVSSYRKATAFQETDRLSGGPEFLGVVEDDWIDHRDIPFCELESSQTLKRIRFLLYRFLFLAPTGHRA
jgi:hypothetical protein